MCFHLLKIIILHLSSLRETCPLIQHVDCDRKTEAVILKYGLNPAFCEPSHKSKLKSTLFSLYYLLVKFDIAVAKKGRYMKLPILNLNAVSFRFAAAARDFNIST